MRRGQDENQVEKANGESVGKEAVNRRILPLPKWISAAAFLLVGIEVAFLVLLYCVAFSDKTAPLLELAAESTLLSTGLTIIGLAVAVWTGLNIANTIDKKTLDDVQRNSEEMARQQKKAFEDLDGLKDSVEDVQKTLRLTFEQELLRTSGRLAMSYYFYELFSQNAAPTEITAELIIIEQLFAQIYEIHDSKPTGNTQISEKAKTGIGNIEKLLQEKELGINVKLYLRQRNADFHFYQGYENAHKDALSQHEHFAKSAQQYEKLSEELGIAIPRYIAEFDSKEDILARIREFYKGGNIPNFYGDEDKKPITIFMINTIGEAYSKILQYPGQLVGKYGYDRHMITEMKLYEYAYRAIFLLSCAKKWSSEKAVYRNEVYVRNLGCAYERLERMRNNTGEYAEEIIGNYKLAYEWAVDNDRVLPDRVTSIYKVLLTYYNRFLKENALKNVYAEADEYVWKGDIQGSQSGDAQWISSTLNCFKNKLKKCAFSGDEERFRYLEEMRRFSEFGIRDKSRGHLSYVMNGLAYTYILFLKYAKEPKIMERYPEETGAYLKKIEEDISFLDMTRMKDDFSNQLRGRYAILMEYEKTQKKCIRENEGEQAE